MALMPPVRIELIADIKRFMAAMKSAEGELDKFSAQAKSRSEMLGKVGNKIANGVLMTGAAIGVASVKMAMDFQTSMTKIETGAGEAHANIKLIHDGILAMSGDVGKTPKELADGFYLIASAGYHGADGLKVLKAAAQGAAVGGSDMMTVADGLTTVLNNYGLGVDKATTATSALIQTVALGKTNLTDLSTSLAKVSPTGAALGLNFKDIAGAMATMTAQGYKADMAAERLNTMMLGLATPGAEAEQILSMIGLSAQKVKDSLGTKGLAGTLQMIEGHLAAKVPKSSAYYNDAMQQLMGGQTGFSAALLLTGGHMQTFEENTKKIGDTMDKTTNKVQGMAEVQKTLRFQLDKLKAAGSSALINIGEFLLPKATAVAQWANDIMSKFKKHKGWQDAGMAIAGGLVAGMAAMKLVGIGNSIAAAFGAESTLLAGPIGLAIGAGVLAYMLDKNLQKGINQAVTGKGPGGRGQGWKDIGGEFWNSTLTLGKNILDVWSDIHTGKPSKIVPDLFKTQNLPGWLAYNNTTNIPQMFPGEINLRSRQNTSHNTVTVKVVH